MQAGWPGRIIDGRYAVESVIGAGGMGLVLKARHKFTGAEVALKVLKPELELDSEIQLRFLAEARAPTAIGHPGIVSVVDAGKAPDGLLYLVMELLDRAAAADPDGARRAHRRPTRAGSCSSYSTCSRPRTPAAFVHRDLKPENVFLCAPAHSREAPRLRDRQGPRHPGRARPHRDRRDAGHAGVHGAGAVPRSERRRCARRSVGRGRDVLRDAGRAVAVPRRDHAGDADRGRHQGAGSDPRSPPEHPTDVRRVLPASAVARAAGSVRQRGRDGAGAVGAAARQRSTAVVVRTGDRRHEVDRPRRLGDAAAGQLAVVPGRALGGARLRARRHAGDDGVGSHPRGRASSGDHAPAGDRAAARRGHAAARGDRGARRRRPPALGDRARPREPGLESRRSRSRWSRSGVPRARAWGAARRSRRSPPARGAPPSPRSRPTPR